MNSLVDPGLLVKLSKALKGDAMLAYAITRIYNSENGSGWNYTNKSGVLALISEKATDHLYLKLFDITSEQIVWTHEVYLDLTIYLQCPHFASFESDGHHVIGLLFAEGQNINQFITTLESKVNGYGGSSRRNLQQQASPTNASLGSKVDEKKPASGGGIFGWFKKITGSNSVEQPQSRRNTIRIGKAEGFTRVTHIGYDPDKGFVYENLPQEWQDMFAANGIDKSVLENPKQAQRLVKEMKKFEKKLDETRRPPPPPIPSVKKEAPIAPILPENASELSLRNASTPPPPPPPPPALFSTNSRVPPGPPPPPKFPPTPNTSSLEASEKTVATHSRQPSLPSTPGGRGNLMEQIRAGHKLKSVDSVNIDLSQISQEEKKDLATCLQNAIFKIRRDIEESDDEEDDDWTDD